MIGSAPITGYWLQLAREQADRFWSKVDKSGKCWRWLGAVDKDGYGKFQITNRRGLKPKQKHVRAHRLAFALKHDGVRKNQLVLHACDTPGCVRCLYDGTQKQNRADADHRRHSPRGVAHGRTKLSIEVVLALQRGPRLERGGYAAIARANGVSYGAVSHAVTRRNWR